MKIGTNRIRVELGARADLGHRPPEGTLPVTNVKQNAPLFGFNDVRVDGECVWVYDAGSVGVERVGVQVPWP